MAGQWTAWLIHKRSQRHYRMLKDGDNIVLWQWDSETGALTDSQGKAIDPAEVLVTNQDTPTHAKPRYVSKDKPKREAEKERNKETYRDVGHPTQSEHYFLDDAEDESPYSPETKLVDQQQAGAPARANNNDRDSNRERRPSEKESRRPSEYDSRDMISRKRLDRPYHRTGGVSGSASYEYTSIRSNSAAGRQNVPKFTKPDRSAHAAQPLYTSDEQSHSKEPTKYLSLLPTNETSGAPIDHPGAIFPRVQTTSTRREDSQLSSTDPPQGTTEDSKPRTSTNLDPRDRRLSSTEMHRSTTNKKQLQPKPAATTTSDPRNTRLSSADTPQDLGRKEQPRDGGHRPEMTSIKKTDSALMSQTRTLDESYKIYETRYFEPGLVFSVLWHENYGKTKTKGNTELSTAQSFGEEIYSTIRRMIVIHRSAAHSICVPIHTYGGRACFKRGLTKTEVGHHTMAYMIEEPGKSGKHGKPGKPTGPPKVDDGEKRLGMVNQPIGIRMALGQTLHTKSRIRFDKVYTLEHGCKVKYIGFVQTSDLHLIFTYFYAAMSRP